MNKNEKYDAVEILSACLDSEEWGSIVQAEQEGPGVFYLMTKDEGHTICREFYAVAAKAVPQIISRETLAYGTACGEIHLFEYGKVDGWELIQYELERYRLKTGAPAELQSLYCTAIYAAEKYPEYFGGVMPPRCTPEGLVLRVKKIYEGIYFLETERCHWMLAVSYPIWNCDLSKYTQRLGKTCAQEQQPGVEEFAYLYFSEDVCAPAIYELLDCPDYQALMAYITSRDTLETYLYRHFPAYVIQHNMLEVSRPVRGGIFADIMSCVGCVLPTLSEDEIRQEQERRAANCIHFVPGHENERLLNLPA